MASIPPVNYSGMLEQLDVTPLLQAFQLRRQNRDRDADNKRQDQIVQLSRDKFTADQHADQVWRADLKAYADNPTAEGYRTLWLNHPEHYEALKAGHDEMAASDQRDVIETGTRALGALSVGNVELATKIIRDRRDALKSRGVNTDETDAALALASSPDPAKRRRGMAFLTTALTPGAGIEGVTKIMQTFGLDEKSQRENAAASRDERRLDQGDKRLDLEGRRVDAFIRQGDARVDLSRAAGARAAAKANGGSGGAPTAAPPMATATLGGKHYTKRGGKWYQE